MATDGQSLAAPEPLPDVTRVGVAQVDALFNAVTLGVCAAAITAIAVTAILSRLAFIDLQRGAKWSSYIVGCAVCHILLCRAYRRLQPVGDHWRSWALWFTMISFFEGIGWGWAPVGLIAQGHSEVEPLMVLVVGGISAGAVPAFSPYLPAFFALLLPATVPYVVTRFNSSGPVQHATCLLILLFIAGIGGLGVTSNRSFKQLVRLRIRAEQLAVDLQRQKEIAEQANLAKSTFLAAASHDLRQPIHALGLFIGALRGITMSPEGRRLLEQIEASTNAMDGLFTALLDISRLDAGTVEVRRRFFAIEPLLDRVCGDHAEEARAKGVGLVWKRCDAIVDTDPVLLERILRNLVSNAVRYTDRGRIVVGCRRRGAHVAVQVWDTGRGIPAAQQDRVFQEYYQIGNPERDRTQGLGLGLAIVRRLTDLLACKLVLRSQPSRGSCFEVTIPLAGDAAGVTEAEPEVLSGAFAHGLIVVIDDERAIREAMSSLLKGWGHDVIAASSGDDAIRRLSPVAVRPDLVICDYRLRDGENGIVVIERLRAEYNATIPAMLITGDTAPDRLAEAEVSGLLLLHKPVSNSKLRAAIINLATVAEAGRMAGAKSPAVK